MMTLRSLAHLARENVRADARGAAVNAVAACIGIAALVFFVALGQGVGSAARRMFPGDARLVEVVPAAVSIGSLFGGGVLDDAALGRLSALPGVEHAWPKLNLKVPIAATKPPEKLTVGWPEGLVVQIPAVGVDPGLVAADVTGSVKFEDHGDAQPIPVVASKRLLEIYNKTLAPSWNLPRIPAGLSFVGAQLAVEVGRSFVPGKSEDHFADTRLELAGLSDRVPLYTLAMPIASVRRLHAEFHKPQEGYSSIVLMASRPDDVPAVAAAVRRMGFAVDESDRQSAERVGAVVAVTTGALALLALLMVAVAALAIAQSLSASVRARRREIAILRAVGATPGDVARLVLAEAAVVGLAGGVAGAVIARLAGLAADRVAVRVLPDFPFRPETFFHFAWWLPLAGIAIAVAASVLGAFAPARSAARLDPARAIA